jgi:hypothetical protein
VPPATVGTAVKTLARVRDTRLEMSAARSVLLDQAPLLRYLPPVPVDPELRASGTLRALGPLLIVTVVLNRVRTKYPVRKVEGDTAAHRDKRGGRNYVTKESSHGLT